ncbi:MAG: acyl-CoA desaturase [Synechococcaceae bacterium WB6_1A_059]|nr:acyl-CoA desaturase [Synechococcaceae bacterium WB6_1A_059]
MLPKTFNSKIKLLQLTNLIVTLIGIVYLVENWNLFYFFVGILSFLIFGIIGANAGYHRYFSHRSYQTYKPIEIIMAIIGTLATLGSIISWVAVHRYHHLTADTDKDPHSPRHIGWWRAYTYDWNRVDISKKFIRDVIKDPFIVFLHKNYFKIIFVYIFFLALIDPMLVIFAYCLPATGCLNGVAAVTVIGHIHGYVSHHTNDSARNSWISCILSLGEGWHNNHHAKPYNWKQGERWWEIDPPAWFIRLVKK